MRRATLLVAFITLTAALNGCGLLGGAALTALEVAGRYRFTEYTLDPVSDAVRDARLLGSTLPEDVTLLLREDGSAALQRLRDDQVGETLTEAAYTISGRTVTVTFEDAGAVAPFYMPASVDFEAGDRQLRADVPMEAVDMEAISSDYRGITRADAALRIRLREIG